MIRLDATTRKLQAILAGAVTANQLPVTVCYSDKTATAYTGGTTVINTNSAVAVDICAAPAASTVRDIDTINVQNADTAAATITIRYNDNGTTYTLFKAVLDVGDQLTYVHGQGWNVIDSTGAAKGGSGGGSGTVTSVSVVSANGLAGTVATPTTTPAITLSTSITGLLKGNGTAISAAVAGTDYLTPAGGNLTGGINSARGNITQHATTMDFFAITSPDILDGTGGAVTITACVNAPQGGATRKFYPIVATVLTHGATFDIAGNANLTAAAGDCWIIEAKTVSTYRVKVEKEDGRAAVFASPQIQPISASVAANALTISASALSLDFRNATLTSGAVTTVSGTPANLVISSGSTLGTVSAVQSRLAVLVLNNAGTLELAVSNMSGGVDLSETGVISTTAEGGAGAADTKTVVYSTTARTSVAYRVIGYIESTQATAGTWATAPSTIQGAGGQALTAMSSLGYSQTWKNVTGSRALATTYYNTTGRPIEVSVYADSTGAGSTEVALTVNSLLVSNPTINAPSANYRAWASAIVPPGATYVATSAGTTGTLSGWYELR